MKLSVCGLGIKLHEVLDPVVIHDTVDMVDDFGRKKRAPQVGSHDQTMFIDIASRIGAGMVWNVDKNVSPCGGCASAVPVRGQGSHSGLGPLPALL